MSFAGNHVEEVIDMEYEEDHFGGGMGNIMTFVGQKIDIEYDGDSVDLPKIVKQMYDFISLAVDASDMSDADKEAFLNAVHLDNVSVSDDAKTLNVNLKVSVGQ